MSSDLLRRAAAKLHETASAADFGPWEVGPKFGARDNRVYVRQEGDLIDSVGTCVIAGQAANKTRFRENAVYIALMHPGVGLALGDVFEQLAGFDRDGLNGIDNDLLADLEHLAAQVLGEDGESQ